MTATTQFEDAIVLTDNFPPAFNAEVENLLNRNRLNWEVQMEPMHLPDQTPTKFYGVVRQDTRKCFHVASSQYQPMQNRELAELACLIQSETDAAISDVKTIYEGGMTFITMTGEELPVKYANVGDVIATQITLWNSQDGSSSFGMGLRHKVLSCKNGMSFFKNRGRISIRHTRSLKDKLREILDNWFPMLEYSRHLINTDFPALAERTPTKENIQKVLEMVADVELNTPLEEVSTRKRNQVYTLRDAIMHEMKEKGGNLWGLLNGVTYYHEHKTGDSDSKVKSRMFGSNANKNLEVFDYLMSL